MCDTLSPKIMVTIPIKKSTELAKTPTRGSACAAGYDLYATETYTLKPLERKLFKTGISMAIPEGFYGRIAPRSGLAYKNGLDVMAGVIDEDYRGDVGVILINLGQEDVQLPLIKDGKEVPIAQIIIEPYAAAEFQDATELPVTNRGDGGFGSSDKKKVDDDVVSTKRGFVTDFNKFVVPNTVGTVTVANEKDIQQYESSRKGKTISELYQKEGGVPIRKRYVDEIKERDQK